MNLTAQSMPGSAVCPSVSLHSVTYFCSPTLRNHAVASYSTGQFTRPYWWRSNQFSVYRDKYYHWSVYCEEATTLL